jgi:hypothetical protein
MAVVPPAVPLVDDVLPGAPILDLLLTLESTVLPELQAAHHDRLLVLLLHGKQGFQLVLGRQGRACARSWGSRHRPARQHLLEMVSRNRVYVYGYRGSLPRTGA